MSLARVDLRRFLLASSLAVGGGLAVRAAAAPPSSHEKAQELLSVADADATNRQLTAEAVSNGRKALDWADEARKRNAENEAQVLDGIALTWAEMSRDLTRAVQSEAKANQAEKDLTEVETKIDRAQALLEETVARQGRAEEKLKNIEATQPKKPEAVK